MRFWLTLLPEKQIRLVSQVEQSFVCILTRQRYVPFKPKGDYGRESLIMKGKE